MGSVVERTAKPIKEMIEAVYYIRKSREDNRVTLPERFRNIKEVSDIPISFVNNKDFAVNIKTITKDEQLIEELTTEINHTFEKLGISGREKKKEIISISLSILGGVIELSKVLSS